jgi:ATP-dependent RNA helicase DHX57
VKHITDTAPKKGGILIFLPGVQEITQCMEAVRAVVGGADILPLHANLSSDDQRRVFVSNPHRWKIVAATNVAEVRGMTVNFNFALVSNVYDQTSITIDDVIYVVDSGKVKETSYDPENGLSRLSEIWITRAAGRQRRGRAGRTQPGTCYKLYTRRQEGQFGQFPIPEIKRVPLESIALSVKVAKGGEDAKVRVSSLLTSVP